MTVYDNKELFEKVLNKFIGNKKTHTLDDHVMCLSKLGLSSKLFYKTLEESFVVELRGYENTNIYITTSSEISFVDALLKAFTSWYIVYSNKTYEDF